MKGECYLMPCINRDQKAKEGNSSPYDKFSKSKSFGSVTVQQERYSEENPALTAL
jgi:hypothetical protein